MKRALLLILVVALAAPAPARSQSLADDPRVASALNLYEIWLEAQLAYEGLPGFSAAIVHDQELVWSKGFGFGEGHPRHASDQLLHLLDLAALLQLRGA